ncbi:hypothetical protein ACFWP7_08380 [Streptomyces sp. NPDC058470]|uniref:hypothetical protein n=1 Tax=Streptomyces sp. NPDC058470 TaxID=3346515 RepID=UPI00364617D3
MSVLSLPEYTCALRDRFAADGYLPLPLPALMPPEVLPVLDGEVRRLGKLAVRRDFAMDARIARPAT